MFVIYVSLWPLVVCCWNLPPPSDYRELGRKDRRRKWREMGREKVSQTLLFRNRQERPHRGRRSLGAKERIQDVRDVWTVTAPLRKAEVGMFPYDVEDVYHLESSPGESTVWLNGDDGEYRNPHVPHAEATDPR